MDNSAFKPSSGSPKPQRPKYQNDSILESLRSIGGNVGKTIAKDVVGGAATDALTSLFGGPVKRQGELTPNKPFNFQKDMAGRPERMPFPGFRRPEVKPREPFIKKEEPHLKEQIQAVQAELKALAASIKSLSNDIQKAVTETPVDPGIYHKNFYERIRSVLKLMREQIDDSRTWLNLSSSRKSKKGYWGKYKKHGTSFGLSNERTLATQSG